MLLVPDGVALHSLCLWNLRNVIADVMRGALFFLTDPSIPDEIGSIRQGCSRPLPQRLFPSRLPCTPLYHPVPAEHKASPSLLREWLLSAGQLLCPSRRAAARRASSPSSTLAHSPAASALPYLLRASQICTSVVALRCSEGLQ